MNDLNSCVLRVSFIHTQDLVILKIPAGMLKPDSPAKTDLYSSEVATSVLLYGTVNIQVNVTANSECSEIT